MITALRKFTGGIKEAIGYALKDTSPLVIVTVVAFITVTVPIINLLSHSLYTNEHHATPFLSGQYRLSNLLLFLHILAATPAMVLGPWALLKDFRNKHPVVHRKIGKIYVFGCLVSAVTVLPLALFNMRGFVPRLGFSTMAVLWFFITLWGYYAARRKDFVAHRRWLMRSYAMTFAFCHVNFTYHVIGLYYGTFGHFTPQGIGTFMSAISWMANLFFVEIYLAATTHAGKFVGWERWGKTLFSRSDKDKFYLSTGSAKAQ